MNEEEKEGIQAIVFLQSLAGIDEPEEKARRSWKGFADWEKQATLNTYRLMNRGR